MKKRNIKKYKTPRNTNTIKDHRSKEVTADIPTTTIITTTTTTLTINKSRKRMKAHGTTSISTGRGPSMIEQKSQLTLLFPQLSARSLGRSNQIKRNSIRIRET
jgi:hypothetical protein